MSTFFVFYDYDYGKQQSFCCHHLFAKVSKAPQNPRLFCKQACGYIYKIVRRCLDFAFVS